MSHYEINRPTHRNTEGRIAFAEQRARLRQRRRNRRDLFWSAVFIAFAVVFAHLI